MTLAYVGAKPKPAHERAMDYAVQLATYELRRQPESNLGDTELWLRRCLELDVGKSISGAGWGYLSALWDAQYMATRLSR